MELKPGYKKTEVGVIPDGWECVQLGEVSDFVTSGSRGWAQYYSVNGDALFLRSQNVRDGKLDLSDRQFVKIPEGAEGKRTKIKYSDVLITITGNSVGNVAFVEQQLDDAYISQHVGLVRLADPFQSEYVCRYLSSGSPGNAQILLSQSGQSKPGLTLKNLKDFLLAVPPLSEQTAIVKALGDMDALLKSLDRLIAKKRDIKQAAMQQLLTGKTRLPGFEGEWEVKRLGEICDISMGRTPSRLNNSMWGNGYVWLSISDLKSKIVSISKEQVTEFAALSMPIIPKGTLLMSFKLSIGRLCFAGCDLFTNEAICSFNNLNANAEYVYYALSKTDFSLYGKQAVKGCTLNKNSLAQIKINYPFRKEQAAIADVLSDMDAEISALEKRRAKTADIKQAMMQELLTGKTRLI